MTDTQIDRILSEDEILPSSGFVGSVMDAVRQEASVPPPIPFPWKRALPVAILGGAALVLLAALAVFGMSKMSASASSPLPPTPMSYLLLSALLQGNLGGMLAWSLLALAAAFVSVFLSLRIAGRES